MSTLVGREPELAEVAEFLRADEAEAALALVGEPGIGKTAVWEEAVRLTRELDALVLAARPAESEATLSFAGLTDLLGELEPGCFETLPPPQRHALEVAVLRAASERPAERRLVGTALLSLLRALAAERLVVLAVDDAHWLDTPSAAAVAFATRRLAGGPVRVLVSLRSETERAWLGTAGLERQVRRLELGPLSVASLHRVIADRTGKSLPRPILVRIAQVSGGNPLYALEIAQLLTKEEHDYGAALPVPADLQELVVRRLVALPEATRAALLRVAALARPTLELVDVEAITPAEEAGLVRVGLQGRVEFTHPLFASAVYTSAPRAQRREAHAALAETIGDPEQRAHHLALAADGPDEEVAQALEDAGRSARRRGAPDVAAHLTELALKLAPEDDPRAAERRLELAEHLHLAGDFQRSGELLAGLERELPPGDLRARALLLLAEIDYWRAGESAAIRLAEQAAAEATGHSLRARCLAFVAMWAGTADVPRAAEAARASLELLEEGDADPALLALALGARVRADLFLGNGLDLAAAERALAAELAGPPPAAVDTRTVFKLGQWLRYVDDLDGSRLRLEQAERQAREEGDESSLANILLNRTLLECWAGDWQAALELADRSEETFELTGVHVESRLLWRSYVEAHLGRLEAVRAAAEQARASEPVVRMIWERSLGLAALAAGETAAADEHFRAALESLERIGWREPAVWRIEGDAIEAALGAGDLPRAERLVDRLEQQARSSQIPWSLAVSARCRGLLLAAQGQLEQAAETLERALREHERSPVPFERARTLLAYGQVLRRGKQKRRAREALEEAAALFERLGAEPWAARAHEEQRRTAARAAPTDLSETELKIATLAAEGLTNRAIAAEVFVSTKTVEANLGRVYRKLGIRSRAQLARALEARERQPIS